MLKISDLSWRSLLVVALGVFMMLFGAASASAQSPGVGGVTPQAKPTPTPEAKSQPTPKPQPTLERHFFANILQDQRAIWTSPFHVGRDDVCWLAPLGVSTAILFATDRHTAGAAAGGGLNPTRLRISRDISQGGSLYAMGGTAAAFYLVGRATGNGRARETGVLAAEAVIDSSLVVEALKVATQRPRPRVDNASGEFFDGGNSFPSGHSISAWSLATVVASEYGRNRLIQVGAYGLATAVSVSRFTGRNHFLSDVLVGSAMGYGIGRYVYRKHHDTALDADVGEAKSGALHSKLLPFAVSPHFSRAERTYGLALAWDF
jgi:membrane-associated phospholipid phosphatase